MSRVLDLFWWLSVLTVGALSLLLLWSLLGKISLPIRIEGLRGFTIANGENFSMELPVALEGTTDLANIQADYRFPSQPGGFVSVSLAILVGLMLLVTWMLDQLRKVAKTVARGDPFASENAKRIAMIGVAVIIFEIGHAIAVMYWSLNASDLLAASGSPFKAASRISAPGALYGFLFIALAAVFREGTRLRDEQSLTI
jgi:hypothetical protein